MATIKKTGGWQECGEKGILSTMSRNVNWYSYYGKAVWRFLKKLKTELPCDPAIPLGVCIQRKWNHYIKETSVSPCLLQYSSQWPRGETASVSVDGWMDKENVIHTHTHTHMCISHNEILLSCLKTEGSPVMYDNMGGLWGHYAEWNSQRKTFTVWYHLNVEVKKSWTHRNNGCCCRRGGEENGDICQRIQTSNYKMNKLRKSNIQQYTRASLVAQLVKNPPAMRETPVGFLGWDDPLEKG